MKSYYVKKGEKEEIQMMVLKGPQDGMDMRFLFRTECNNRWK